MNSNLIPLLCNLQPGYKDADQWIDQLLNRPDSINWQVAFRYSLDADKVGACIFDVDQNTGFKVYEKFFTLKVKSINKVVPGKPYVYEFECDSTYEPEDVMVNSVYDSDGNAVGYSQMIILNS